MVNQKYGFYTMKFTYSSLHENWNDFIPRQLAYRLERSIDHLNLLDTDRAPEELVIVDFLN